MMHYGVTELAESREENLIYMLLQQSSFISVADVANQMDVSTKTIYRLVKKLNQEEDAILIEAEKGKGIRINYQVYLKSHYNKSHGKKPSINDFHYNFSPIERRLNIMKELLFHAPLSLREDDLFAPYYLSQSAIYLDEDIISKGLEAYGLILQKKNARLSIEGPEHQIRQALIYLLTKLNIIDFNDLKNMDVNINQRDLHFIISQVELIEKEINSVIPAPYNVNLLTHLYILLYRAGKGDFDQIQTDNHQSASSSIYYPLAQKVTQNIEGYICKKLPDTETVNICNYLSSSRIESERDTINNQYVNVSSLTRQVTQYYIDEFSRKSRILIQGTSLKNELASHISPMLHRLATKVSVVNPMLDDIQQEYQEIYQFIREISDQLPNKFGLAIINDDEVGFITLYFARYMEEHPRKIRIVIVCTTGLGTSELLRTKVERFFPELDIIGTASLRSLTPEWITEKRIDLILTTIQPPEEWPVPSVLVNTLFISRDRQNVRNMLNDIWNKPSNQEDFIPANRIPIMQSQLSYRTKKENFFREMLKNAPDDVIQNMDKILISLDEREKIGDTCIAPHIALAHTQLPFLSQPYFAISILKDDVIWDVDHNMVNIILMILLPTVPGSKTIEQLHNVMRRLADDDIVKQLQMHKTPEEIRSILFA